MRTQKLSLISCLLSLLLVLPGWRSYQVNSELQQFSDVQKTIGMQSVVVLDEKGEPVCRADLSEHPELVPDFAQLNVNNTVDSANSVQEALASSMKKSNLPSCTGKYLSQLEEIATNNIVVNSDKSYMHKASLQKDGAIGIAACILGASAGFYVGKNKNIDLEAKGLSSFGALIPLVISTFKMSTFGDKFGEFVTQMDSAVSSDQKQNIHKQISKFSKGYLTYVAVSASSACYIAGDVAGMLVYMSN